MGKLQRMLVSKVASCDAETEVAKWTQDQLDQEARTSSDHQGASGSCGKKPQQQRRLLNTRRTSFCSPTTGHESQRNGQKVDSAVRESPEQGVFPAGLE